MSRSDSDSLEFESADEGGINPDDINLSDLDLDSDNEDDIKMKKNSEKKNAKLTKENKLNEENIIKSSDLASIDKIESKQIDEELNIDENENENHKHELPKDETVINLCKESKIMQENDSCSTNVEIDETKNEKEIDNEKDDETFNEEKLNEDSVEIETHNNNNNKIPNVSNDESLSKENLIEKNVEEEKVIEHVSESEDVVLNDEQVKIENSSNDNQTIKLNSNEDTKAQLKSNITSGWDDTEFSDLDDDNLIDEEPHVESEDIKSSQNIQSSKETNLVKNDFEEKKSKDNSLKEEHKEQQNQHQHQQDSQKTGWSWSKFGSSFISSATSSVANITNQLGTGLTSVLETVEATIGAPDPAELAAKIAKSKSDENIKEKIKADQEEQNQEQEQKEDSDGAKAVKNDWDNDEEDNQEWFSLPPLNKLANTGNQIVAGSLDLLETVGKKTIEALNDKDPNLKQTREFLKNVPKTIVPISQKPNLSQLLREAQQSQNKKDEIEIDPNVEFSDSKRNSINLNKSNKKPEKISFGLLFDEYKGVAHLEALEMLSRQSSVKLELALLEKPLDSQNEQTKSRINHLDELFDANKFNEDIDNENDYNNTDTDNPSYLSDFKLLVNNKDKLFDIEHFEFLLNEYAKKSNHKLPIDKIVGSFRTTSLASRESLMPLELHNESIKCFALITSKLVEFYHKAAEFILVEQQNYKQTSSKFNKFNPIDNAEALYQITKLSIHSLTLLANDYCKNCRSSSKDKIASNGNISINQVVTDIYLEASNSSNYICDAFLYFLPIFKSQLLELNDQ